MSEGHPSLPDREDDRTEYVQRFEDMLSRNDHYFFDVEEFELIIEHYLDNNDLKKARQVLDYARQQHPGSVDLLFCEAQVLMGLGKLNGALDVLDSIQKLEPFNEDVHLHKASIHSQLRNYRKAIEHYRKALELADEGLDDIYLDLAFEHENCEQFDEAIVCLKKALDVNPENEAVLYELAYCFDLAEAHEASVVFFRNFTNEHPYSFVSWYNLGNALAKLNRLEESNQALELCLAIEEEFSSAYFSKARNLLQGGEFEAAIACYQETLNIDGPQAVTFSYIGECYEKMERYEQALIHYDQALALDPNWVDAWIGRGVVRDFQGKLPEAIKDLENAVRIAPDSGDGWFYLGNVLARAERFPEAVEA
ncbi:MAG: tetratricopeptide repeat protein, partial [Flavobacteriales bacterium]|nr:tetratricopeptide repeat protein [Flavobacteriales bacterium]